MIEKITWPVVALVAIVMGAIVGLAAMHVDISQIGLLLSSLGIGGVFGVALGIRDQVNGKSSKQLDMIADAQNKLAKALPIADTPPEDPKP